MVTELSNQTVASASKELRTRTDNQSYFDGTMLQFLGRTILTTLLVSITLGICTPVALVIMYKWKASHTVIEGQRLCFHGKVGSLFGGWILWMLFSIVTLGIYGLWIPIKLEQWKTKHTYFV